MTKNFGWTFFAAAAIALLQVAVLVTSARVLSELELGLIAMCGTILALTSLLIDSGFSPYIIYKGSLSRSALNSLLLVSSTIALLAFLATRLVAENLEQFFSATGLADLVFLYAFIFFTTPFTTQFQALFVQARRLKALALIDVGAKVLGTVTTIVCLLMAQGANSIVYGLLCTALLKATALYAMLPKAQKINTISVKWAEVNDAWRYCSPQLGSQFLNYLRAYVDNIIIGLLFSMEVLGLYSLARELVAKVASLLNPIAQKLLLPVLAEKHRQKQDVGTAFSGALIFATSLSGVCFLLIGLNAELITNVLYGSDFVDVINVISLLTLFYLFRIAGSVNGMHVQATGRTHRDLYWNCIAAVAFPPLLYVSATNGLDVLLTTMVLIQAGFTIISYYVFHYPALPVSPARYFLQFFSIAALISAFVAGNAFFIQGGILSDLTVSVIAVASMVLLVFALMGGKRGISRYYRSYDTSNQQVT